MHVRQVFALEKLGLIEGLISIRNDQNKNKYECKRRLELCDYVRVHFSKTSSGIAT